MATVPAIGIDLGTTYSCVGVFQHGRVEIIENGLGNRTTPSYVAFTATERLVGDEAKEQANRNPSNTVYDVKRLIGRRFDDETVQSNMKYWPFSVVKYNRNPNIQVKYKGKMKTFCPEEISSMVLAKMKEIAEARLGKTVTDAVVTVPAHFNNAQRQATKDAGTIAGINVIRIMDEPTAAAIAYGLENKVGDIRNVLIFDLGGGNFDVSVVTIEQGIFEVKSTAGDSHLGGEDFDNRMVSHFLQEFERKHQKDLTTNKRSLEMLKTACEKAKKTLSAATLARIQIDALFEGIDFDYTITRARFEELNAGLFNRILGPLETALSGARLDKAQIHDVVLVGGSSRIPKIQRLLEDFFHRKDLNKSINPDEAAAYGATVQAAILQSDRSKQIKNLLLLDVIPLSLRIKTDDDAVRVVIKKNTTIPTRQTLTFATSSDNQRSVLFEVYEGESAKNEDNNLLAKFELRGIPPARKGVPGAEVTFDIDANCILRVFATDESTGRENQVAITDERERLSKEQIERMVKDAEKYRDEQDQRRSKISSKISLESYAFHVKSILERDNVKYKTVLCMVNETLRWLDSNQLAEEKEYERRQKVLESVCGYILRKL